MLWQIKTCYVLRIKKKLTCSSNIEIFSRRCFFWVISFYLEYKFTLWAFLNCYYFFFSPFKGAACCSTHRGRALGVGGRPSASSCVTEAQRTPNAPCPQQVPKTLPAPDTAVIAPTRQHKLDQPRDCLVFLEELDRSLIGFKNNVKFSLISIIKPKLSIKGQSQRSSQKSLIQEFTEPFSHHEQFLRHLLLFPLPTIQPHKVAHQFQAMHSCYRIPKTFLSTLIFWGDGLRIPVPHKRSCRNHSSEILKRPPELEMLLCFSSLPRGMLVREQRLIFQQEMLILDLSAMHNCYLFLIKT